MCCHSSCRITKSNSNTCAAQGVPFGVPKTGKKCNTAFLCPSSDLAACTDASAPCCRTCKDFAGSQNWFWQCTLPRSVAATYTFEMLAGQYYYMGKCQVTVSSTQVVIGGCQVAPGWAAAKANFYLGKTPSTTCSPGKFGYEKVFSATTGALPSVGTSMTRKSTDPIFVMLHFDV